MNKKNDKLSKKVGDSIFLFKFYQEPFVKRKN